MAAELARSKDEETLADIKACLSTLHERRMEQVDGCSLTVLKGDPKSVDLDGLLAMKDKSPTALNHWKAFEYFFEAFTLLDGPNVAKRYSNSVAFKLFVQGIFYENLIAGRVPWNLRLMLKSVEDQIRIQPKDYAAHYVRIWIHWSNPAILDEEKIRELEILANDMEQNADVQNEELDRKVLYITYYHAASLYTVTDQGDRGTNLFHKCLTLYPDDHSCIYALAFNKLDEVYRTERDNKDALRGPLLKEVCVLCEKYLSLAPKCDKKYPAVLYQLSAIYLNEKRFKKYLKYYEMAVEEEARVMPYDRTVSTHSKVLTQSLYKMLRRRTCFNPECPQPEGVPVHTCTGCGDAVYCGKGCQGQHRRIHKKKCAKAQK